VKLEKKNKNMEYTYKESIILQNYYLDKLIGKSISDSFNESVTEISIREVGNDKYLVIPGFWHGGDFIYIEINKAVKMFDLTPTKQVLLTHQY
jgi:hypothetical protein